MYRLKRLLVESVGGIEVGFTTSSQRGNKFLDSSKSKRWNRQSFQKLKVIGGVGVRMEGQEVWKTLYPRTNREWGKKTTTFTL